MPTLNGRPATPSGDSTLDARLCAELGSALARARVARGLTVGEVGEKLLLSTRQVKALETVEFAAFHNAAFHLGALRKYAVFAELDSPLLETIASGLVKPDPQAVMLVPSESSDDANESGSGRWLSTIGTVVAVAVLAAGGYYLAQRQLASSATRAVSVPAPAPAPAPRPAALPAAVEPAVASSPTPLPPEIAPSAPAVQPVADTSGFGVLRVLHPTWIFVRDMDNLVTERSLAQGESFVLETQPNYLAVGTPDAELSIGARRVDVEKFVSSGQIRIRAGDFDALVQGASPIQAPTAAARP